MSEDDTVETVVLRARGEGTAFVRPAKAAAKERTAMAELNMAKGGGAEQMRLGDGEADDFLETCRGSSLIFKQGQRAKIFY